MNEYIRIPAAAAAQVSFALQYATDILQTNAVSDAQLDLFGYDQACETFMAERDELKDRTAALEEEGRFLEDILLQTSRYHIALKAKLSAVGIGFETGEDGLPVIFADCAALALAIATHIPA